LKKRTRQINLALDKNEEEVARLAIQDKHVHENRFDGSKKVKDL
jgi:phage shock protein A